MRAVADRAFFRCTAAAEISIAGFFSGPGDSFEFSAFVCTIAKWLLFALATGAVVIRFAFFDFGNVGGFFRADRLVQDMFSRVCVLF